MRGRLKKGKLDDPVQFGYKVQVTEVEDGLVTDFTVDKGSSPDVDYSPSFAARVEPSNDGVGGLVLA